MCFFPQLNSGHNFLYPGLFTFRFECNRWNTQSFLFATIGIQLPSGVNTWVYVAGIDETELRL